jgi:hypothetical protein
MDEQTLALIGATLEVHWKLARDIEAKRFVLSSNLRKSAKSVA